MVINIDTRGYQFIDVEIWFCEAGCEDQYFCEKHIPVLSDPSNLVKLTVAGGDDGSSGARVYVDAGTGRQCKVDLR